MQIYIKYLGTLTSCTSIVFLNQLIFMLVSQLKKISFFLSEIRWKVAKLKYGSWLHIYNTKNNHMAPECVQVARETYCNYVMMCFLRGIQHPFLPLYLFCSGAAAGFKLLSVSNTETEGRSAV